MGYLLGRRVFWVLNLFFENRGVDEVVVLCGGDLLGLLVSDWCLWGGEVNFRNVELNCGWVRVYFLLWLWFCFVGKFCREWFCI